MLVYILMLLITIVILYFAEKTLDKKNKNILYICAIIPFILVSAIRYDVGTDYFIRYVPDYNSIVNGQPVDNLEFGFKLLIKFCALFTAEPQILFVVTSIITNILIFSVIYKSSKNIILSIIIMFFNGFFFSSLNIVRQCMATGIIFIGYTFLIKENNTLKNNILYIIFVLIACSIHTSSIITASFIFFTKKNVMNWKYIAPLCIIILILGENLLIPFKWLLQNTKYSVYFLEKFLESDISIMYVIENTIVYALMNIKYYYDKKNNKTNKEEILFLNIEGLCLLITFLANCHIGFDRVSLYCLSFQILSIPFFINKVKIDNVLNGKLETEKFMGIVAITIIMFIAIFTKTNILNNNCEVVPYKTIFNKNFEIW